MDIIEYYKNLLILQYRNKAKAVATIENIAKIILQDNILLNIESAFNPETAVGKQLDILAKYLGLDRFLSQSVVDEGDYYSMISYYDNLSEVNDQVGMTNYANYYTDSGGYLSYSNYSNSQKLSDDDFRFILNMRIAQNNSNLSNKSIDEFLYSFYGQDVVASGDDRLSITYFVKDSLLNQVLIAASKKVLPKPIGVKINGILKKDKKYFGFCNYENPNPSPLKTGFTNYTKGFTGEGRVLKYNSLIKV